MNHNMRKMYSEQEVIDLSNQAIEESKKPHEYPMEVQDVYSLLINTDEDYIYITENLNDLLEPLQEIVGKYLYGYNEHGQILVKALILTQNPFPSARVFITPSDIVSVASWKIFDN